MVGSGVGRTELPELRQRGTEPRPLSETDDRQMREPGTPLALVHPEPLEPALEVVREPRRGSADVPQHEHSDASRFSIALRHEPDRAGGCGGLAQRREDGLQLRQRPVSEEGKGDMQLLPGDAAAPVDVRVLPATQSVERLVMEAKATEQACSLTTFEAIGQSQTDSSRLCCKSRRTRCSAVTVARRRIDSRSPGKTKSALRSACGPAVWRYTSPTGFPSLPPAGPAIPVTASATSAWRRLRAPVAIAAAVSAETAPCRCRVSSETPRSADLTLSAYETTDPTNTSLDPGTEVRRSATIPPVHDSAVASFRPRSRQRSRTSSSIGRVSRLNR